MCVCVFCFRLFVERFGITCSPLLTCCCLSVRPSVRPPPRSSSKSSQTGWLLVGVCPLSAPARPGLTLGSSPPQHGPGHGAVASPSQRTHWLRLRADLAAGAVLRHGLPHRSRIGSVCLLKRFFFSFSFFFFSCLCYVTAWSHSMYAHSRQGRGQGHGRGGLESRAGV